MGRLLKDLVTGALLYCEEPPTTAKPTVGKPPPVFQPPPRIEQTKETLSLAGPEEDRNKEVTQKAASIPIPDSDDELNDQAGLNGSDLEDLGDFLRETGLSGGQQMTKRAQR